MSDFELKIEPQPVFTVSVSSESNSPSNSLFSLSVDIPVVNSFTVTIGDIASTTGSTSPSIFSWNDITDKPTFATIATSGSYNDLFSTPSLFNGSWESLSEKPSVFPPEVHNQAWSTITTTPTTLIGYGITDAATSEQGELAASALQPGAIIPWTNVSEKPAFFDGAYSSLSGLPILFDGSWDSLSGKPTTFPPETHTHTYADLEGKPLLFSGAWNDLSGIPATFTPSDHNHAISDTTGLQDALNSKLAVGGEAGTVATIAGLIVAGTNITTSGTGTIADPLTINAAADPLDLTTSAPTVPPADTVRLFRREIAGRQFAAQIGPSGLDNSFQPLLARNKIGYWCPPGNASTVPGVVGFTAPTVTGFTATSRVVAVTNMFTRMRRIGYVTAATAAAVGQFRTAAGQYTIADMSGLGGFFFVARFGISDAAPVAGARMFFGMRSNATPANAEPSTLTNCFGVGHGAADTNLKMFFGGSATQTPVDLGADFPIDGGSVNVYELALYAPANAQECSWEVTRVNTGHVATGVFSGTVGTQIPAATTLLCAPWAYRTNNATALAVGMDVMSFYIETDY